MKMTKAGIDLIVRYEGVVTSAYPDPGTGGEPWTIGVGHTSAVGPPDVKKGMKITKADALDILKKDLATFEAGVRKAVKVPLTDSQFAALVSFAFNVGLGNFRKSSVLRAVNLGQHDKVPGRMGLWVKAAGRVLPGLVKRRRAEGKLYGGAPLTLAVMGDEPVVELPSAPELDEMRRERDKIEPISDDELLAKPVLWHRRLWATITSLGGAGSIIGWFTGWDWKALIVLLVFFSLWAVLFMWLYRRDLWKMAKR